jgi:hypothetical protein
VSDKKDISPTFTPARILFLLALGPLVTAQHAGGGR